MRFYENMMFMFNRAYEVASLLEPFDAQIEHDGDITYVSHISQICPEKKPYAKSISYSFVMECDSSSMTATLKASLHHLRSKISPEDLISIGNELNAAAPYCPYYFDEKTGRGVVGSMINLTMIYDDDETDTEFHYTECAMTQFVNYMAKLQLVAAAYIEHDCV